MSSSPPELESFKFDRDAAEHWSMLVATARPLRHDSKGFTLVELLIVIVILGVLAVVAVFAVRGITDRGQENAEATDLRTLETANEAYYLDHGTNASEQELLDNGYINELSSMYDMAVDGAGVLTITNVRTGGVAGTALAAGSGAGVGGDVGAGGGPVGSLDGLVKNATNEAPISGVSVCVRNTALCTTTDGGGAYALADVPIGEQTLEFTLAGFTTLDETVTIVDGSATTQNTALSPQLAAGDLRIVLTWGEMPSDLDSYLWVPGAPSAVYYSNPGSLNSAPYAQLDADDTTGFGPETITISQLDSGSYSFAVRALGGPFVAAETTVRVYDSGGLLREFTPPSGSGGWWRVFQLDGSSGTITAVNTIGSSGGPF